MLWLSTGLTIGILNGLTLRRTINLLRPETSLASVPLMALGFLLRMGFVTALLVFASQHGLVPGLLACTGLWLARWITMIITLSPRPLARFRRS
ncbi:MAG: hypothetical protein JXA14_07130 [Anaerolineae bacterium]|jgi:hypothetical protein|nr:hypothetical protein [Anaerolineae bacterium]